MNNTPFHRGAIHEAGHAVMARKLGAELGLIAINLANPHEAAHAQGWISPPIRRIEFKPRANAHAALSLVIRALSSDSYFSTKCSVFAA